MIHTDLFFYLSLVVLVVGSWFDIRSSRKFIYYGSMEGMPLWQDKQGFFDVKKNVLWFGIFVAAFIALKFAYLGNQVGIVFYIIGVGRFLVSFYNESGMKKRRAVQTDVLTKLSQQAAAGNMSPNSPEIHAILKSHAIFNKGGKAFFKLFGWLQIADPGREQSVLPLRQLIIFHAQRPSSEWFPE